jgi:two-component system, OmpR family, sensor histidine kinase SenX3
MMMPGRRRQAIFFTIFGVVLVTLTVALQVGWIVMSVQTTLLLVLGVIVFALIIAGLVLNTIFLVREIRKNEQQDAFLNSVTHELKTPVASIKLYLETLQQREIAPEKRKEFYRIMQDDTQRLMGTIEQVLEASRVGMKRQHSLQSVSLSETVQDCINIARSRHHLAEASLHLTLSLPTGDRAIVRGDAQELKSAVSNLIDNPVKYSGPNARVQVELTRLNPQRIAIRVTDQGVGIQKEELKRIFGRFYRIPGAVAQKVKGTGLGLFIVKAVARKHGGRAYAQSEGTGQGSTFTMELASELANHKAATKQ